jgi:hypothetical protein
LDSAANRADTATPASGSIFAPPALAPSATAAAEPTWPMPVATFLAGKYMRKADVVLTRKQNDWKSWFIRWAINGKFSHAAMVFLVPHEEVGFDNTFVIEAASEGVDLTNLTDYVNDRRTILGIKRVTQPWFTSEIQSRVRGHTLNSIKSRYSYGTLWQIAKASIDRFLYGVRNRFQGPEKALASRVKKSLTAPNEFICSGLVQMGYAMVIGERVKAGTLPPTALAEVIFDDDLAATLKNTDWSKHAPEARREIVYDYVTSFEDVLEAVTPEDLAHSKQLDWVYVIRDGLVYPVMSDASAGKLLDWDPREPKIKEVKT